MSWIQKIRDAIDYIEANLSGDITADTVGRAISYSPSSFQNIFSAVTGYSIGEYVRFRRLSLAADEICEGLSVTDAAFKYGYENAESFSRAFKRLFGYPPSGVSGSVKRLRFNPISISYNITGGLNMTRNLIPNLSRVDWSDPRRQSEFVNSVVSALGALGERLDYDYVCALSGSAFRTSFSMPSAEKWNHGNYHVVHTPQIIGHTFKMLGYGVSHHILGSYEDDRRLITDSIDRGVPVITLEGVINCSDACVISGYDNDGDVLLGYNPFMYIEDDHKEAADDTGYFRKSGWHKGYCAAGSRLRILIIGEKRAAPDKEQVLSETLRLIKTLIKEESLVPGQYNGLAAHRAFASALQSYEWEDNFDPYLNVMCNYKQYLDRQYAASFLRGNDRDDLAQVYEKITELSKRLGQIIPQDFSASDMFSDRDKLKPFCDTLLEICALEEEVLGILGS
ncbi:MAG: helix-turn-helix transcriptional regulator [Eubacteriales bacterium]